MVPGQRVARPSKGFVIFMTLFCIVGFTVAGVLVYQDAANDKPPAACSNQ